MPIITRIAVVGFGLVGKRHAEAIRRIPELELGAIVEPNPAARAEAIKLNVPCFATLEEMFAGGAIDGVVLATPTPMHVAQGLTCIEKSCPLLIEKPISVSSGEAQKLTQAANRKGVPLLVGHHRRHNGMVRAAKAAIDEGAIGELRAVQATSWFHKPDHYFAAAPWRTKKGAGPISVNLVHDVDLLRHFCGEVIAVQAHSVPSMRGFENEDLAAAILTFQSGAVATISVSDSIAAPWSWELTAGENPIYPATPESCYLIGGSEGALSIPDLRLWHHDRRPDWWTPIAAKTLIKKAGDPLTTQAIQFAAVIRGEQKPVVSALEGARSLQVVEAIQQAAASKKLINISPLEEVMTNYEIASA